MSRFKAITKKVRIKVINMIAFSILGHTERPTSEEYTTVCKKLISKYPVLRDTIGNGYVSIVNTCMYG